MSSSEEQVRISTASENTAAEAKPTADAEADELQAKVDAMRDDLGNLVGELDRRRHRAGRPVALAALAAATLGIGGYVLWRIRRPHPSRARQLGEALKRMTDNPDRVAQEAPNASKKILTAAASAAAAVVVKRLAERWMARRPSATEISQP